MVDIFCDVSIDAPEKSSLRKRADKVKRKRCRYLLAVLENPGNIHNVGAIIRNIDGLGVGKLYIVGQEPKGKKNNRSIHNTSSGASKYTYVRYFDSTKDCLDHLKLRRYKSLVTSPHQKGKNNIPLLEGNYTKYSKLAVWFGNEGRGITPEAIEGSQGCINIDMCGLVESLNLSVSTALVLHYVASKRREYVVNRTERRKKRSNKSSLA